MWGLSKMLAGKDPALLQSLSRDTVTACKTGDYAHIKLLKRSCLHPCKYWNFEQLSQYVTTLLYTYCTSLDTATFCSQAPVSPLP